MNKQTVPVEINIQDGISVDSRRHCSLTASMTMGTGSRSRRMIMKTFPKTRQRQLNTRMSLAIWSTLRAFWVVWTGFTAVWPSTWNYAPTKSFEVTVGEALPIQVLYEGNLIKDVLVEYLGETVNVNEQGLLPSQLGWTASHWSCTSPTAMSPGVSYATSHCRTRSWAFSLALCWRVRSLAFIRKSRLNRASGLLLNNSRCACLQHIKLSQSGSLPCNWRTAFRQLEQSQP